MPPAAACKISLRCCERATHLRSAENIFVGEVVAPGAPIARTRRDLDDQNSLHLNRIEQMQFWSKNSSICQIPPALFQHLKDYVMTT